jgi:hypothetical protein
MTTKDPAYLVVEPGLTPLRPCQWLTEDELDAAETRFGPSSFAARPASDVLDDWLIGPPQCGAPSKAAEGLLMLGALFDATSPHDTSARLCRQAVASIDRLDRLRRAGAPEIMRLNERRMIAATARALLAAAAPGLGPQPELAA